MSTESVLDSTLLTLQLCLGFWQMIKFTPVGVLIRCSIHWCMLQLGLPSSYAHLKNFDGRIFKKVECYVTTAADHPPTRGGDRRSHINFSYLGVPFRLQRAVGNRLLLNETMEYYITDKIWNSLLDLAENLAVRPRIVFLKGYKEFWQGVASGGVMSLSEVLDCLILDNHGIIGVVNDYLVPVNSSVSEEKLPKLLNLVGLFLQTKKVYWLVPLILSFTAAILEFCTSLRVRLYALANAAFCCAVRLLCDCLPLPVRRQAYSLEYWVENLKPGNDIELRVLRGNIRAVIGGGAKVPTDGLTLLEPQPQPQPQRDLVPEGFSFWCEPIGNIKCYFYEQNGISMVCALPFKCVEVKSTREEFERLVTFVSCVARNASGSLRSYSRASLSCLNPNSYGRVRGFRESVIHYVKSGFPPVYELQLENTVVK